jgi:hypothetical protein
MTRNKIKNIKNFQNVAENNETKRIFYEKQYLDYKNFNVKRNLFQDEAELSCLRYEEKFDEEINNFLSKHGITALIQTDDALHKYKHWLESILKKEYSKIDSNDIIPRIMLRAHRYHRFDWISDIPDIKNRILIDKYETYSDEISH